MTRTICFRLRGEAEGKIKKINTFFTVSRSKKDSERDEIDSSDSSICICSGRYPSERRRWSYLWFAILFQRTNDSDPDHGWLLHVASSHLHSLVFWQSRITHRLISWWSHKKRINCRTICATPPLTRPFAACFFPRFFTRGSELKCDTDNSLTLLDTYVFVLARYTSKIAERNGRNGAKSDDRSRITTHSPYSLPDTW